MSPIMLAKASRIRSSERDSSPSSSLLLFSKRTPRSPSASLPATLEAARRLRATPRAERKATTDAATIAIARATPINHWESHAVRSVRLDTSSALSLTRPPMSPSALTTPLYVSSALIMAATPVLMSPLPRSIASSAFFEYFSMPFTQSAVRAAS